jgi:hypothetical protein
VTELGFVIVSTEGNLLKTDGNLLAQDDEMMEKYPNAPFDIASATLALTHDKEL